MNKAVFIDKDGTLINDVPYNVDPALIALTENAGQALSRLKTNGFMIIVVSNQSGIAHGYFAGRDLDGVKKKIFHDLREFNAAPDGFYFCPHHPDGKIKEFAINCDCRKPKPGMIVKAAHDLAIDVGASWMIGDILHDVEAGNKAGCKTILINNGNETLWDLNDDRRPFATASNLIEAADVILAVEENKTLIYDTRPHQQLY